MLLVSNLLQVLTGNCDISKPRLISGRLEETGVKVKVISITILDEGNIPRSIICRPAEANHRRGLQFLAENLFTNTVLHLAFSNALIPHPSSRPELYTFLLKPPVCCYLIN